MVKAGCMLIEEVNFNEIHPSLAGKWSGKKFVLYWDIRNKSEIAASLNDHYKKCQHFYKILAFLIQRNKGIYDNHLYRKENNGTPNLVVAMKFTGNKQIFKNLRIYCQEHFYKGRYHIVLSKAHREKKNQENSKKEISIINSVAVCDYFNSIVEIENSKHHRRT